MAAMRKYFVALGLRAMNDKQCELWYRNRLRMSLNYSWRVVCRSTVTNVAKMESFEVMCETFDAIM
jgi:hypothetical protein